jgi:hypothetical protein
MQKRGCKNESCQRDLAKSGTIQQSKLYQNGHIKLLMMRFTADSTSIARMSQAYEEGLVYIRHINPDAIAHWVDYQTAN